MLTELKKSRLRRGLRQLDVAVHLGVAISTYRRFEISGKITLKTGRRLAKWWNASAAEFAAWHPYDFVMSDRQYTAEDLAPGYAESTSESTDRKE